ncbi:MAG TPA: CxxxxCH/CxxCH domain-containing protein, partial [Deferrisomatales bacterium]|nr:CxxxxCH/CxxCH domain-containing protein [Deferrisomatales bacterium]
MKRSTLPWIALAALGLVGACSDQNAPDNRAHPDAWVLSHGSDTGASGSADDCTVCHGASLDGGNAGVACLDCHVEGPPFRIHPSTWGANTVIAHLRFAEATSWTRCATAACHGTDLKGGHGSGDTGPSCFSPDALGCHADGPPAPRSHRVGDTAYADPALHGADARGRRTEDESLDPQSSQFYCRNCHGTPANDFGGGFVTEANYPGRQACVACHPEAGAHPGDWIPGGGSSRHAGAPEVAWVIACGLCHEVPGQRGSSPLAGAPSCFGDSFDGASCHGAEGPAGALHPLDAAWLVASADAGTSHVAASLQDATGCLTCHVDLEIPPVCGACHSAGDPLSTANRPCVSCHAQPPSEPGTDATARPGRQGAHGGHAGLTADTADCSSCHGGAGTGTTGHWDTSPPATVTILAPTYQGQRGTAGYSFDTTAGTGTCADVSCHGGQVTPRWLDATLDVDQDCDQCHELGTGSGVPEANSYYSGAHARHTVDFGAACTACHDAGRLATGGHFADLATAEFEGVPGDTMGTPLGYDSAAQSCLTSVTGCHSGQLRTWSGAAHPVNAAWLLPSGTAATSHVLDSIRDRQPCLACHTLTGGGTDPACGTCHDAPNAIHFTVGQCDSCHNRPPDAGGPVANVRPNRAGAHGGHAGLTTDTGNCSSCHQGAGTDTTQHYDPVAPATVAILTDPYQGRRGAAAYSFNAGSGTGTCANISCHGGKTTPPWLGGSLIVAQDCAKCHDLGPASPEANSYYSGRHITHIGYAAGTTPPCAACHDAVLLSAGGHFAGLDTPAFEGDPAATMRDELAYDATEQSCSVTLTGCHVGVRPWEVPHPVDAAWLLPTGSTDTSHVLASLADATECLYCHNTLAIPPVCIDCHKVVANDPLTTAGTCVSCHADPPGLASAAVGNYPQREGAHAEHDLLPGIVGNCGPCHTGAGTGTTLHMANGRLEAAPADVVFLPTYNAKSGTAARNSDGTCSAVRCHGGVLTPVWGSGSIDRANQCEKCHTPG